MTEDKDITEEKHKISVKNEILEGRLRKMGLSEIQAKIYLALLYVGKGTLVEISRMIHHPHPSVLPNLRWMVKRGLVMWDTDEMQPGKKKYYYAFPPSHGLRRYFKGMIEDVLDIQDMALQAIDGFQYLFRAGWQTPEVKFLKGKEMLPGIHEEVWNSTFDEAYEFTNLDESYKIAPKKKGDHRGKFRKLKKPWTCIYTHSQGAILPEKDKKGTNYNIPQKEFPFKGEIACSGEKVFLFSDVEKLLGVVITDKTIANTVKQLYRLALKGVHCMKQHRDVKEDEVNRK